mmetsp:Transcript_40714/g.65531  ORF Transcript_40714/g.65531 Transcript_40714/m.65531 type:complete len:256 (-) Transcript_40714:676-1443(-)
MEKMIKLSKIRPGLLFLSMSRFTTAGASPALSRYCLAKCAPGSMIRRDSSTIARSNAAALSCSRTCTSAGTVEAASKLDWIAARSEECTSAGAESADGLEVSNGKNNILDTSETTRLCISDPPPYCAGHVERRSRYWCCSIDDKIEGRSWAATMAARALLFGSVPLIPSVSVATLETTNKTSWSACTKPAADTSVAPESVSRRRHTSAHKPDETSAPLLKRAPRNRTSCSRMAITPSRDPVRAYPKLLPSARCNR